MADGRLMALIIAQRSFCLQLVFDLIGRLRWADEMRKTETYTVPFQESTTSSSRLYEAYPDSVLATYAAHVPGDVRKQELAINHYLSCEEM